LPALVIVDTETEVSATPEAAEGGVQVWREQGEVCAYGYTAAGANWLQLPRVATYRFTTTTQPILAVAAPEASERTIVDGFERTVLPLALQFFGSEALHASGVVLANGVIALCGDSGVGKSTLAHVLSARGHQLWADDAVAFECRPEDVMAIPLPFRPILLPSSVAVFGDPDGTAPAEQVDRPLACVVVLGRSPAGDPAVSVTRCAAAEALEAAITHAYCYRPDDLERSRRMMTEYLELVARVPVFAVNFVNDLDGVGGVAERVEALGE
jgi:hypothetical protein